MSRALVLSKLSLAAALFLFTSSVLAAQTLAWAGRDGGVLTDPYTELGAGPSRGVQSQSMVGDSDGNIYVIGTLYRGGVQGEDIVVLKFDATGVRQWAATYDSGYRDQAYGLALDGNGDAVVLGREMSTSWFVLKLDGGDGARRWIRTLGNGRYNALAVDSFGNTYVAGAASGFRVLKLDANGVQQWSVASGAGEAQAIEVDPGGNVYAAGTGFKAVKYDGAGVQQWLSVYGGTGASSVYDLDLDGAGNLYLTGYRHLAAGDDMLTLKLDGTGAQQWEAAYDGGSWDLGTSLVVDGGGNVYVTGQSDTLTGGDFVTLKYSPAGALLWSASDDTGGGFDISYDVAVDAAGNATVTGRNQAGASGGFHTIQYDPSGATRWEATWDGPDEDQAQAVLSDPLGNVYVAGTSRGAGLIADLRVIKYDAGGAELWSVKEGATNNAGDYFGAQSGFSPARKTLAVDPAGGAWLAGSSFNGLSWDMRLTKFDASGARQWTAVLDTGQDDEPVAVTTDASGNVYAAVFSLTPPFNYDFQVAKYDATGTLLWQRTYDGGGLDLPADVAVDAAGNVVVTGWTLTGPNPYDFLILKYDAAGTLLWSATYDGGRTDIGTEVETDAAGNIIVSGPSQGADLEWDTTTLEYDPAGNLLWSSRDVHFILRSLTLGADGNVYLLGDYQGTWIVKYDTAGTRQWRSFYNPTGQDFANSIAADAAGNVYAAGVTQNGTDQDFLTLSLDASGAPRWVATYDGGGFEVGQSLALDGGGNVYVAGYGWNGVNDDVLLVKYDAAGTQQWAAAYDNGSNDYGYAVALDSAGGVYVAGDSVGSTTGADLLLLKYVEPTQTRTVGFTVAASSLSEKANSAALSVVLTTSDGLPSTGAVSVAYTTADGTALAGQDYTAGSGSLTFPAGTPSGTTRTVTVPLLDDSIVEGGESFTVQLGSPTGAVLATAVHTVTILDDDKAGFDVRPRSGLRTGEDGGSDTFTIALTSQPTADVSLTLSSDDLTEGTVFPGALIFTPADWNLPRTVTVTGVDDLEVDGNVSYTIVLHPATSADANYQGLDADDVRARNQDNDRGRGPRP